MAIISTHLESNITLLILAHNLLCLASSGSQPSMVTTVGEFSESDNEGSVYCWRTVASNINHYSNTPCVGGYINMCTHVYQQNVYS